MKVPPKMLMILSMHIHESVTQPSSSSGSSSKEKLHSVIHSFGGLEEALLRLHKAFSTAPLTQNATCVTDRPLKAAFNLQQQDHFSKFPRIFVHFTMKGHLLPLLCVSWLQLHITWGIQQMSKRPLNYCCCTSDLDWCWHQLAEKESSR